MEVIAKRILEQRKSLNLSQMKLAKAIGIAQSAINRYEHDQAAVPDYVMLRYAEFFDVSLDYLFGRTDNPEGAVFKNEPEVLKRKAIRGEEWEDFVEACFDPRSPMNKKLKEMIMRMAGGDSGQ